MTAVLPHRPPHLRQRLAGVVASLARIVELRWRRWALWSGFVVGATLVIVLAGVTWRILGYPVESTGDAVSQGTLALGFLGLVATVGSTGLSVLVLSEARRTRVATERDALTRAADDCVRALEGHAAALQGAALDVVQSGSTLATLIAARRVWRARSAEPLMTAVTSASKAVELIRYQWPGAVASAANALHAALLEFMEAVTSSVSQPDCLAIASRIGALKSNVDDAVRAEVIEITSRA